MIYVLLYNFALIALACYMTVNYGRWWILILIFYNTMKTDKKENRNENIHRN